jgi:hypothetical protein
MKKLLYILLAILVAPAYCFAAVYVDNQASCTDGDNTYNPATRTCGGGSDTVYTLIQNAIIGELAGTLGSPKVINIRSGTDYHELVDITKDYMTLQKYSGDGSKPVILGNDSTTDFDNGTGTLEHYWTGLVDIRGQGITIDGIEIAYAGHYPNDRPDKTDRPGHGIYADGDSYDDITITNCYIHHIGGHGIGIKYADNLTLTNNEIFEAHYGKLEKTRATWGSAIMTSFDCDNVTISGNTIHGIGGEGLNLNRNGTGYTISGNTIYDCLMPALFINGMDSVDCFNNIVYHTNTTRYTDGGNIKGIIVASESFNVYSHYYNDATDVNVYQNMVAGCSQALGISEVHEQWGYQVSNIRFYNNTVIEPVSSGYAFFTESTAAIGSGVVVKNNIFWKSTSGDIASVRSNVTCDYNLWSKQSESDAQGTNDPTYSSYPTLSISDYFAKTNWTNPTSITSADFQLLDTATYAIGTAVSDSYTTAYSITYDDLGALDSEEAPETIIVCTEPTGTLPLGTTTDNMECSTSVDETLKFDTSDVAYSSMGTTFGSTGGTTHLHTLSGLSAGSYIYYVRASDSTYSTVVSFSVEDTPSSGTNLLSGNTYVPGSDSNSYDSCYALEYLWDDDTRSGVCYATIGGSGITSATPQFDLGQLYDITEINVFGDASGSWVCDEWTLEHKQESDDSWTEAWSAADCNADDWDVHDSLSITARYLKFTFTAPTSLQVREAVVFGSVSGTGGGGGGGGGVISGGGVMSYSSGGAGVIN